jgi:type I restriction enzyme S subunit
MNKPLTEVCNITTGKLDANAATINGAYPFFTCAPDPLRIDNYAFDDDAILLAGNNAQGNFHINRYCGKFNAYQRTYVITAKDGYDIDYIKYSIELSLEHLKKVSQGSQTKFLTMQILNSFKVSDIPYTSQQKLIKSIKKIDQKIELNNRIIAELEAMAKTIYDYWFVQFDFPNVEGKPYRSAGGEMVWNEQLKREIPKGWGVNPLPRHCQIIDCLHSEKPSLVFENEDYYLLQLDNLIDNGLISLANKYYVSKEMYELWTSRIEVVEGDLVITNAGRVGAIARIPKHVKAGIGRNMTAIRPNDVPACFLYYFFTSSDIARQIKMNTDLGSFFRSLNVRGIKELKIILPPKNMYAILNKFEDYVSPLRSKIELLAQENLELTKLRDWLLPMLMNGQVNVE